MLDLACEMRPCPLGATRHRKLLAAERSPASPRTATGGDAGASPVSNEPDETLPFLTDASTGVALSGADAIVAYLYATYLDGAAPSPWWAPRPLASARASLASAARGGADALGAGADVTGALRERHRRRVLREALPWRSRSRCSSGRTRRRRFARWREETLSALEIPYVSQPCARGSPRRTALQRRAGTFQVPYLEDPNTGVAMFESAEIVAYLRASYQATPPKTREER